MVVTAININTLTPFSRIIRNIPHVAVLDDTMICPSPYEGKQREGRRGLTRPVKVDSINCYIASIEIYADIRTLNKGKIVSVFMDCDSFFLGLDGILRQFGIPPTIQVNISPKGRHFFWVFREPIDLTTNIHEVIKTELNFCGTLPGDITRVGREFSRIPGQVKDRYSVGFESSDRFYSFKDFDRVPTLSPLDMQKVVGIFDKGGYNVLFEKFRPLGGEFNSYV